MIYAVGISCFFVGAGIGGLAVFILINKLNKRNHNNGYDDRNEF